MSLPLNERDCNALESMVDHCGFAAVLRELAFLAGKDAGIASSWMDQAGALELKTVQGFIEAAAEQVEHLYCTPEEETK